MNTEPKIYDYPKEGTIPLGVHMMQSQFLLKNILQTTKDILPTLIKIKEMRRKRMLSKWHPGEGIEDEATMQEPEPHTENSFD